jgi:uncharacterized MnhB-related membrane protein
MTFALALEIVLAAVVLTGAVWSVASRETLPAIAGFVAYGLLLALVWVRLGAPDVALTEAAIGSGLTGALLVGGGAPTRQWCRRPWNVRRCCACSPRALSDGRGGACGGVLCLPIQRPRSRRRLPRTPPPPVSAIRSPTC